MRVSSRVRVTSVLDYYGDATSAYLCSIIIIYQKTTITSHKHESVTAAFGTQNVIYCTYLYYQDPADTLLYINAHFINVGNSLLNASTIEKLVIILGTPKHYSYRSAHVPVPAYNKSIYNYNKRILKPCTG